MGDIKLVKKITDWNPTGLRNKGRQNNRWRDKETWFKEAETEKLKATRQR